jgi:uncharacterized protein YegP (UPF0339 family)
MDDKNRKIDEGGRRMKVYIHESGGQFFWNLKASNGRIVATTGERYKSFEHCRKIIEKIFGDKFAVVVKC